MRAGRTSPHDLRDWVQWRQRPFPDANLLFLHGTKPALIVSGFVGHAEQTADWGELQHRGLELVANTQWYSDHVGGNYCESDAQGLRSACRVRRPWSTAAQAAVRPSIWIGRWALLRGPAAD